jgi:hypothetical protein
MTYSQIFHQILYFPSEKKRFFNKKIVFENLTFVKYDIISVKLAQVLQYISEALGNLLVYLEGTLCTLNNASPKTGGTFQCGLRAYPVSILQNWQSPILSPLF